MSKRRPGCMRSAVFRAMGVAALLLCNSIASAQDDEAVAIKQDGQMNGDELRDAATVSGGVLAGLSVVGQPSSDLPRVEAWIPKGWAGHKICLALVSSDGRYDGSSSFSIPPDWNGGRAHLIFETKHHSYLASAGPEMLASLVYKGSCNASPEAIALSSWNASYPPAPERTNLVVNSYRADEVYVLINKKDQIVCSELEMGKRTSYDFTCGVPTVKLLIPGSTSVEIVKIRSGKFDTSTTFLVER